MLYEVITLSVVSVWLVPLPGDNNTMITVLLVDDHELVRMGIRSLLEGAAGIQVVGEADSGEEAVKQARTLEPDVILMDVRMPGIGGLEATRKITNARLRSRIIALTALNDDPFPKRLLEAGAAGYLTKDAGVTEMVEARNNFV